MWIWDFGGAQEGHCATISFVAACVGRDAADREPVGVDDEGDGDGFPDCPAFEGEEGEVPGIRVP